MPACAVGISPWVNLNTDSASYDRLAAQDPVLSREVVEYFAPRYAGNRNRNDPRLSPLFAKLDGLPPTLIQIGDRECFLGDAVGMHEALIAAGVDTEIAIWKEMFHVASALADAVQVEALGPGHVHQATLHSASSIRKELRANDTRTPPRSQS
jgi:acetyl esterase/lipase